MDRDEEAARRVLSEHNGSELFEPFVAALRSAREEERRRAATICRELPLELEDHKYPSPEERWLMGVAEAGCRNAFADAIESGSEKAGNRGILPQQGDKDGR